VQEVRARWSASEVSSSRSSSRLRDIATVIRLLLHSNRRPNDEAENSSWYHFSRPDIVACAKSAFFALLRRLDPHPVLPSSQPTPARPPSLIMGFLDAFWGLLDPWLFMWESLKRLPPTVVRLVRERQWRVLSSWSKFQSAWFGTF